MERPYSLYDVLNVSPGAPPAAIEAAYRALMKKHHPDHAGAESAERAAEINAAFTILRDPVRRSEYDCRERARVEAITASQVRRWSRMRRARRTGLLLLAGLVVSAAVPFAANLYLGGIVPQRAVAAEPSGSKPKVAPPPPAIEPAAPADPIEHVADFLSRASVPRALSAQPAKARQVAAEAEPEAPRVAQPSAEARSTRERTVTADRQPRAAREEVDFLEREDFIY